MRKSWIFILLLLLSVNDFITNSYAKEKLQDCQTARVEPGISSEGCLIVDGRKRKYRLHIPEIDKKRAEDLAVIIGLHGGAGTSKRFERFSQFSQLSNETKAFIAIYPQGIDKHWNDGRSNFDTSINDVKFFKNLVRQLKFKASLPIDLHKIFISGISNGGVMSLRIACEHTDWIKGAAIVAATLTTALASECVTEKPLPILFIFGDKDTAFLDNGKVVNPVNSSEVRGTHIGIKNTLKKWQQNNGCSDAFFTTRIDTAKRDGTSVEKMVFRKCQKPLIYYKIINGGHRWPNEKTPNGFFMRKIINVGIASHDINAAREIWDFFKKL